MSGTSGIITQYAPLRAVVATMKRVATSDASVLISGETGTGKSLFARAIHDLSGRRAFAEIDCRDHATVDWRTTLDSRVPLDFARDGRGNDGDGIGTLVLHHVDVLPPQLYPHLQRRPAGMIALTGSGPDPLHHDVLTTLGRVWISLPPVRERRVDIPLLAAHFLGKRAARLTDDALDALERYSWPGNVRELKAVIERASLRNAGGVIHVDDLSLGERCAA